MNYGPPLISFVVSILIGMWFYSPKRREKFSNWFVISCSVVCSILIAAVYAKITGQF